MTLSAGRGLLSKTKTERVAASDVYSQSEIEAEREL